MRLEHLFEDVPAPNQIAWFNTVTRKYISLDEVPHSQYALNHGKQMGLEKDPEFKRFLKIHKKETKLGDPDLFDADEEFLDFMFKNNWVRITHQRNTGGPSGRMAAETNIHSNNLRDIVKAARFINKSSPIKRLFVQADPWDESTSLSGKRLALFLKHGRIPSSGVSESNLFEERQKGKSLPETDFQYSKAVIYRAVVSTVNDFLPMDYVTMSRKFAVGHAEHLAVTEEETAHVLRAIVKASDVYEAYNPGEYFYDGPQINGRVIHVAKGLDYEG